MTKAEPSLLVVDDEVDTCQNLSDIFTDLGYRVETAFDGAAALEKVRRARYDVAVLDLMMPGMDGLALYNEINRVDDADAVTCPQCNHTFAPEDGGLAGSGGFMATPSTSSARR